MEKYINIKDVLVCPVCGAEFERRGKSLFCLGERSHCFDFASSGYVNLLPPGKKNNSKTGDDPDMIAARKRFLASGIYDGISRRIGEIAAASLRERKHDSACLIDCGCGDGRHTCNIIKTIAENQINILGIGFDASKSGAKDGAVLASREKLSNPFFDFSYSSPQAFFSAGNIFSLPVKNSSANIVTSLFAPVAWEENRRVLKDDGLLIVCASGARHLCELRELLYDKVRLSSGSVRCPEGFAKVSEEVFSYKAVVDSNRLLKDLFMMTPFYYRTSPSDKAKLDGVSELEITVETVVCTFSPEK